VPYSLFWCPTKKIRRHPTRVLLKFRVCFFCGNPQSDLCTGSLPAPHIQGTAASLCAFPHALKTEVIGLRSVLQNVLSKAATVIPNVQSEPFRFIRYFNLNHVRFCVRMHVSERLARDTIDQSQDPSCAGR
jgi:hypothetical protein